MIKVEQITDERGRVVLQDPPIARTLFGSTGVMAFVWLAVRLYVAYDWLEAGWEKLNSPAWMGSTGEGILGFWTRALSAPGGKPVVTYDWYRGFIQVLVDNHAEVWFSKVIVFGELAVGLGILLGAFVGLAAAGGLTMNMAFMLAGSTSTNPVLAILEILLILAWKNAGYIGIDRFALPMLGTPWGQPKLHQQPRVRVAAHAPAPAR